MADLMAGDDDMQEDAEFGPWCPDIGQEHAWSEWEFSMVGSHECRFCSKCGGMETQEWPNRGICLAARLDGPDRQPFLCSRDHGHAGPHKAGEFEWTYR